MRVRTIGLWAAAWLLSVTSGFAQQNASVSGVVTDESKGVLPGVTVTATNLDSGRVSATVTDAKGEYHSSTCRLAAIRSEPSCPALAHRRCLC